MTARILVLGIASEPPVAAVTRALGRLGVDHTMLDQRRLARGDVSTWWAAGSAGGVIELDDETIALEDVVGVYTRLTDWASLPDLPADSAATARLIRTHQALDSWLEATPARVVNRTSANDTNNSKPYQALLLRQHFDVPATLVTNDPRQLHAFIGRVGEVVFKSISGERSIVTALSTGDLDRLDLLRTVPVQFQERIVGPDIRVHCVGTDVFAARIESTAVDYRYDDLSSGRIATFDLPDAVAQECLRLTHRLGLELSGVDLKLADDGRVICFEVNPSPAFTPYEEATGQPIADAIARHLCGR